MHEPFKNFPHSGPDPAGCLLRSGGSDAFAHPTPGYCHPYPNFPGGLRPVQGYLAHTCCNGAAPNRHAGPTCFIPDPDSRSLSDTPAVADV